MFLTAIATAFFCPTSTTSFLPRIIELFKQNSVFRGAFLTDCNSRSSQQSDAANDLPHPKFAKDLTELGVHVIEGSGSEEGAKWAEKPIVFRH